MRLLTTDSELKLVEKSGDAIPPYAILSHRWMGDDDEVVFADVQKNTYVSKPGYAKILKAIERTHFDGYEYLWVDTCCIDKSSSAELSEAINSMFAWYKSAAVCYIYLANVQCDRYDENFPESFHRDPWFTRGWTLQELLAPGKVKFYSSNWTFLDSKLRLKHQISHITGIDARFLDGTLSLAAASIAMRMSWAASRSTKRPEDIAYCLLGIFDINMPLLYGEGQKAFLRLQEEIMRQSDDHSIFAWKLPEKSKGERSGLLAYHPNCFKGSGTIRPYTDWPRRKTYGMTNRGLGIELALSPLFESVKGNKFCALLQCPPPGTSRGHLAVVVERVEGTTDQYVRVEGDRLETYYDSMHPTTLYVQHIPSMSREALSRQSTMYPQHLFSLKYVRSSEKDDAKYSVVSTGFSWHGKQDNGLEGGGPKLHEGGITWIHEEGEGFEIWDEAKRLSAIVLIKETHGEPRGRNKHAESKPMVAALFGLDEQRSFAWDVCEVSGTSFEHLTAADLQRHFSAQGTHLSMRTSWFHVYLFTEQKIISGWHVYESEIHIVRITKQASSNVECTRLSEESAAQVQKAEARSVG